MTQLPVERIVIDPDEIVAAEGDGFELVEELESERLAFRRGGYRRLIISRRKWVRKTLALAASAAAETFAENFGRAFA